ncbi:MAG: ABC transporter ATP-binding protein [Erysipelotrichaceae bacterium]|nr:ABC transporter ATP-binding protein [Erysipelotrichaceae bacterium]
MKKKEKKINQLMKYLKKYSLMYVAGILILLAIDYLDLYIPQYTGEITDGLASHAMDKTAVNQVLIKMVICALLISAGRLGFRYFIIGTARRIERALQNDIFRKLETLSQRFFNENKTGDLMAYFTNDLEALREALGWSIISAVDAFVLSVMTLYRMMSKVSVSLTLYVLIPMSGIGVFGYFIIQAFERNFTAKQESFAKLSDVVQESVSAERVIKAFTQEEKQLDFFKTVNRSNYNVNMKLARLRAVAWPIMEVLIGVSYMITVLVGGYYTITNRITLGRFIMFASYLGTLVWPMLAFGDCLTYFTQGVAAMKRINKVFNEQAEITDDEHPDDVSRLEGEIRFDHVHFRYGKDLPEVLTDISVEIGKGETFAIMGRTGAGKTTMVNLMTRLFDVTEGSISFDGHDIRKIPLAVLRENIAYVPQDNFLFSETIRQNVSFGKLDATMEEIVEACRMADVDGNISDFPEKYDTMVGERGVTLSGGQKQRISIARALLKDSPILILDDSLSAVDTDTEDNILNNLRSLRQGKMTIIIAHRVSTVQNADHILFLDEGKVAELGSYSELMALDGQFARLQRKQQLEKQLATSQED